MSPSGLDPSGQVVAKVEGRLTHPRTLDPLVGTQNGSCLEAAFVYPYALKLPSHLYIKCRCSDEPVGGY